MRSCMNTKLVVSKVEEEYRFTYAYYMEWPGSGVESRHRKVIVKSLSFSLVKLA